jgi:hypothetical protein
VSRECDKMRLLMYSLDLINPLRIGFTLVKSFIKIIQCHWYCQCKGLVLDVTIFFYSRRASQPEICFWYTLTQPIFLGPFRRLCGLPDSISGSLRRQSGFADQSHIDWATKTPRLSHHDLDWATKTLTEPPQPWLSHHNPYWATTTLTEPPQPLLSHHNPYWASATLTELANPTERPQPLNSFVTNRAPILWFATRGMTFWQSALLTLSAVWLFSSRQYVVGLFSTWQSNARYAFERGLPQQREIQYRPFYFSNPPVNSTVYFYAWRYKCKTNTQQIV